MKNNLLIDIFTKNQTSKICYNQVKIMIIFKNE